MKTKKRLKLKKSVIYKSLFLVVFLVTISFLIMFVNLNVLPFLYLMILIIILVFLNLGIYYCLGHQKFRKIGTILSFIIILLFSIGLSYQSVTLNFLHKLSFLNIETKVINIVILNNRNFNDIKDLSNKKIALVSDESTSKVESLLNKEKDQL